MLADEIVKGHCPDCGPDRFADVVGHYRSNFGDEESAVWGQRDYRILKCRGCEGVYFQIEEAVFADCEYKHSIVLTDDSEVPHRITHYPAPAKREPPDWALDLDIADRQLGSLFADIYGALNAELRVPAAVAARTVFDRASELLKVDPATNFFREVGRTHRPGEDQRR